MTHLKTILEEMEYIDAHGQAIELHALNSKKIDQQTDWIEVFGARDLVLNLIDQNANEVEALLKEQAEDYEGISNIWILPEDTRFVLRELRNVWYAQEIHKRYENIRRLQRQLRKHDKSKPQRVDSQLLDRIRSTPLVDIMSHEGIESRRSGGVFVCNCPFHDEKTPSCSIYSDHFHCFGCQEHGDAITLIQKLKGFNFIEAAHYLGGIC